MIAVTIATPKYKQLCDEQVEHFRKHCDLPVVAIHLKEESFKDSAGRKLELHRMFRGQKVLFFDSDWRAIRKLDIELLEKLSETDFLAVADHDTRDSGSFPKPDSKTFGINEALYFNSGFWVANFALEKHVQAFELALKLYKESKNGGWASVIDHGEQGFLNAGIQKSGVPIHHLPATWNWYHFAWANGAIEHIPRNIIGVHAAAFPIHEKKIALDAQTQIFSGDQRKFQNRLTSDVINDTISL